MLLVITGKFSKRQIERKENEILGPLLPPKIIVPQLS